MPEISRFFGIIIRMFFDERNPPHVHAEYQGQKAVFDLNGNVTRGDLSSRTQNGWCGSGLTCMWTSCERTGNWLRREETSRRSPRWIEVRYVESE